MNFKSKTACLVFKLMQISGLWISLYSWGAYRIHTPALCRWLNVYWHHHCLIMLVFYAYVKVECMCIYVRKMKRMNFNPLTVYVFSNCIVFLIKRNDKQFGEVLIVIFHTSLKMYPYFFKKYVSLILYVED